MCIRDSPETVQVKNYETDDSADELDMENDSKNLQDLTATGTFLLLNLVGRCLDFNSEGEVFNYTDNLEEFVKNKLGRILCKRK